MGSPAQNAIRRPRGKKKRRRSASVFATVLPRTFLALSSILFLLPSVFCVFPLFFFCLLSSVFSLLSSVLCLLSSVLWFLSAFCFLFLSECFVDSRFRAHPPSPPTRKVSVRASLILSASGNRRRKVSGPQSSRKWMQYVDATEIQNSALQHTDATE